MRLGAVVWILGCIAGVVSGFAQSRDTRRLDHRKLVRVNRAPNSGTLVPDRKDDNLSFAAILVSLTFALSLPANAVSGGGLDFANLDITGQDFSNSNYKGKDFTQVIAKGTKFENSNLQGCRFYKAFLVRPVQLTRKGS